MGFILTIAFLLALLWWLLWRRRQIQGVVSKIVERRPKTAEGFRKEAIVNVGFLPSDQEGLILLKFVRTNGSVAPVEGPLQVSIPNGEDAYAFEATPEEVAAANVGDGSLPATDYTHGVWQGVHGDNGLGEIVVNALGDAKIGDGVKLVPVSWSFTSESAMAESGVTSAFVNVRAKTQ